MDYALLLVVTACIAVGVVAAVVRTWSIHARLHSLEDRVAVVEGIQTREVKTRAAQERWKRPDKDLELIEAAKAANGAGGPRKKNWWELSPSK